MVQYCCYNGSTNKHDYARWQVQCCTDKYGFSSRQYAEVITNLEALHISGAKKAASKIMAEIGLHREQCTSAVARRAIYRRLTGGKFNCLSAASIADRKRQLTNHYSAILNSQHNQQQYRQFALNNGNNEIAFRSPLNLLPPKFVLHYGRRVMTHLPASTIFRIVF